MDGQRFDEWTKAFAHLAGETGGTSRRRLVRGLLGGAAAAVLGLGGVRRARADHLLPGEACTATEDCSQVGGAVVCADNGIGSDGALNCCRNEGGACTSGAGCCSDLICADNGIAGDGPYNCCRNAGGSCASGAACCGSLLCVNGVCGGSAGALLPGQPCTSTGQCSQTGGAVVCADNGLSGDGSLNCCRNEGGACTDWAGCCAALHCTNGTCLPPGSTSGGNLAPGQSCTATSQCSQTGGATVCADNGISSDGGLNCCRNQGGACTGGSGCCGSLLCTNGVCGGTTSGGGTLQPGQSCAATSQCSQTGGAVVCADNGIASDGALNCCRNQGGACAGGAGCCGNLLCIGGTCLPPGSSSGNLGPGQSCTATSQCSQIGGATVCADNGLSGDGSLNCCRNEGGACTDWAGCCAALHCLNGTCLPPGSTSGSGNLAPGQSCTATSQCSQTGGAVVCADNGISSDGALNCCRNQGGACAGGAGCCGALLCTNGVCGGTTSGGGALTPGQSCAATSQCSQTGGAVVCADNGIASDGALNCCRNAGGSCTGGAGCCGSLLCTGGVCTQSGSGPVG